MNTKKSKRKNKRRNKRRAGLNTAYKLGRQAEPNFQNTDNQDTTLIRLKSEESGSDAKPIGSLQEPQLTNYSEQEAETSKSTPELGIVDIRKTMGLSGAGAKWYLRYLKDGLSSEEALKKVQERPKSSPREPKTRGAVKTSSQEGNAPNESNLEPKGEKISSSSEANIGTRRPGVSHADADKGIRLAILPKTYPEQKLTREEQGQIEELIVKQMCKGWRAKLIFRGIHFRPGLILVDCATEDTAEWLRTVVPKLPGWDGVELLTCLWSNIKRMHKATVYLPKSAGFETTKLLDLISTQNQGLHTQLWRVLMCYDDGKGKLLTLGLDGQSLETIKNNNCVIKYRFGCIRVDLEKSAILCIEPSAATATGNDYIPEAFEAREE